MLHTLQSHISPLTHCSPLFKFNQSRSTTFLVLLRQTIITNTNIRLCSPDKNAQICPRFFFFDALRIPSIFLDNSTYPHTIESTNLGIACENIIIPMELGCASFYRLHCNPELSAFHCSSTLCSRDFGSEKKGAVVVVVASWIWKKQALYIFGII